MDYLAMGFQDVKTIVLLIALMSFIGFALLRRSQFYLVELCLILIVLGVTAGGYIAFLKSQHIYRDEIGKVAIGGLVLVLWVFGMATYAISKIPSEASASKRLSTICLYWILSGSVLAIIAVLFQSRNPIIQILLVTGLPIGGSVFLYLRSRSISQNSDEPRDL